MAHVLRFNIFYGTTAFIVCKTPTLWSPDTVEIKRYDYETQWIIDDLRLPYNNSMNSMNSIMQIMPNEWNFVLIAMHSLMIVIEWLRLIIIVCLKWHENFMKHHSFLTFAIHLSFLLSIACGFYSRVHCSCQLLKLSCYCTAYNSIQWKNCCYNNNKKKGRERRKNYRLL